LLTDRGRQATGPLGRPPVRTSSHYGFSVSLVASRLVQQLPGSKRWLGAIAGAIAGAAAVIVPMIGFYPIGRLFDPSVGGTPRGSLSTELGVGFVGGVILSPVGACVGALIGYRLQLEPLRPRHHAGVIALSVLISVGIFVALNGGFIYEEGTADVLLHCLAMGVLGWFVGAVAYSLARRALLYAVPVTNVSG